MLSSLEDGDALVMIDLDHFKAVNDTRGHQAGDQILISLAAHLQRELRLDAASPATEGKRFSSLSEAL